MLLPLVEVPLLLRRLFLHGVHIVVAIVTLVQMLQLPNTLVESFCNSWVRLFDNDNIWQLMLVELRIMFIVF